MKKTPAMGHVKGMPETSNPASSSLTHELAEKALAQSDVQPVDEQEKSDEGALKPAPRLINSRQELFARKQSRLLNNQ